MRVTYKMLCEMCEELNEERGLQKRDKGYMYVMSSCGYYQLVEICTQGGTGVHQLMSGTTREVYYYLCALQ